MATTTTASAASPYGGLTFVERSDVVGAQAMVWRPRRGIFWSAPASSSSTTRPPDWMETVNTIGLEPYAPLDEAQRDAVFDLEVQSNPLTLCTYPEALVELTFKAA